jgi:hypothetical protein
MSEQNPKACDVDSPALSALTCDVVAAAIRVRAVSRTSRDGETCQGCHEVVRGGACCCKPAESPSVD